jgi:hypothetical protein
LAVLGAVAFFMLLARGPVVRLRNG